MSKNLLIESIPATLSLVEGTGNKVIARGEFGRVDVPTQNGRIYPAKLMEREINRLSGDLGGRRVLGELDHPCLTDKNFKVLTSEGWKNFEDVSVGDRVWSRKDGKAHLSTVKGIVDEPYAGTVYHVSGRSIDSTFTPAHRVVVAYRPGEDRYQDRQDELIPMADIVGHPGRYAHSAIPRTAEWPSVEDADTVTIPAVQDVVGRKRNNDVSVPLELPTDVFAAFMGLYLSEGSCSTGKRENYNVFIHQKSEWSREFIMTEVLDRFPGGLKWSEEEHGFRLCDARLWKYLKPFGNAYEKYVPVEVKRLSSWYLREFVFWFGIGDGRMVAANSKAALGIADDVTGKEVLAESIRAGAVTNARFDVFSVSERLILDLHECVVKSGGACSYSVVYPDRDYMFAGREIKAKNKVPLHQLHIASSANIWLDPRFLRIEEGYHNGNIYCLSVDGGNFYMEQNGHAFWTGNSDGKTSLKRVSHVITGLKIKNGVVEGEAEILNTPEGKTLKALIEANVQVGVSSRGYGSTAPSRGQHEGEEVQEDFVLKTYDFVADPAMKSAIPGIYTEDVDDETVAKMFLAEFPEIAEEMKGGEVEALIEEAKSKKDTKKEIEQEVREDVSEQFERRLRDALVEMREEVVSEVKEELESDPEVAGAKGVLSAVADMVAAYRGETDQAAAKDAIKAAELEVSEAKRERDEAIEAGRTAAHMLYVERQIGKHPMVETIRKYFSGLKFKNLDETKEALKTCLSELPRADDVVTKEEAKFREENVELRGSITLLEGKVEELNVKLRKAVTLGERIDRQRIEEISEASDEISGLKNQIKEAKAEAEAAKAELKEETKRLEDLVEAKELEIYKRDKVVGFTNGRELIGLMESVHDRAGVDDMVGGNGLRAVADPELQRMRKGLGKGKTGTGMRIEEEVAEKPGDSVDDLGNDMSELAVLAGIPRGR